MLYNKNIVDPNSHGLYCNNGLFWIKVHLENVIILQRNYNSYLTNLDSN